MKKKRKVEKKIDMGYHDYRVKTLGLSDRAKRLIIRAIILGGLVVFVLFSVIKFFK